MRSFWKKVLTTETTVIAYGRKFIYLGPCFFRRIKVTPYYTPSQVAKGLSDCRMIKIPMEHVTHINDLSLR